MFRSVEPDASFPRIEERILEFWKARDIFRKSLEIREGGPEFTFYDGPPFATGLPHYGHIVPGILKDIVPRYWTMRGYHVERRFGWDCHGLPVENEMEKELGISGKKEIEAYGVARFNEACRGIVLRYTAEWRETVLRTGRWVDFDNEYKTMDLSYMETIWWIFRQLWDKGLIYRGHSVQPYCPRCSTPLSNFETNQGYRDVQDPSLSLRLKVKGEEKTWFVVWTTTPWTLPANLGLAVGSDVDYVKVQDGDERYWLAESRLSKYYPSGQRCEVLERVKGAALVGLRYEPPFDFFKHLSDDTFRVIAADFVSTEEGSGIVHMAPSFGEDDYQVGLAEGWPIVMPLDAEGRFTAEVPPYEGLFVKDADPKILDDLKARGILIHRDTIEHAYPHCWRCESPLIYRAIPAWFLNVQPIKQAMIRNNRLINWVPEHVREGRFGSWLENARDWNLSRSRYWGAPIPLWMSEDEEEIVCVGSHAELEERSGAKVTDLHKHFVDGIAIPSSKGKGELRRVPDVLDCWFESGSMPYAQNHYPFENKGSVDANFPGDFIAEGIDQTRGWFYSLLVLSTALFDKPPFKNVIVNGLVLADDGKKMSKRHKNYPEPEEVLKTYGADALRAYLIDSPAVKAEDLRFSEKGIREIQRKVILPLWNAYAFFTTYANIDKWTPSGDRVPVRSRLDRWILSTLQTLIHDVNEQMARYNLYKVIPRLDGFIDDLTNWYIRRSRQRFWDNDDPQDKTAAYQTLYDVLLIFSKVLAPVLPFICEEMYQNLQAECRDGVPESVHLCDYPESKEELRDAKLEREMALARTIVALGRTLRAKHKIKTRQPLPEVTVVAHTEDERALIRDMEEIILDELNVKALGFTDREEDLVHISAKANFRVLGKRLGGRMSETAKVIQGFDLETIRKLEAGDRVEVAGEMIGVDDILVTRRERAGRITETTDGVTVSLDVRLTDELVAEGNAREFKNRIQTMRKEAGFNVSDRIAVAASAPAKLTNDLRAFEDYVKRETLAVTVSYESPTPEMEAVKDWEIAGETVRIGVRRV